MFKRKQNQFFILIIIALYFFDLGNPDAIRQGTEGFYLLISQEMFEAGDLLTPRVYGEHHWSKPPLHFWLPMAFYKIFEGSYLYWARFSVLTSSLLLTLLISLLYENHFKRNWQEAFGFLIAPLYFIKYSRIFMMEMPLALLSTLGALYFYSYLQRSRTKNLVLASLFTGLSVLVKGPVSLALIFPAAFLFSLIYKKEIKRFVLYTIIATIIGSIWFVLSYMRFGSEFFNYFFIRENLGKFTAKNYPITSVIQGLFIYAFPIWLFAIGILKERRSKLFREPIERYLGLCFLFFYFLWFLPKQKSHHYAVPAIPILCIWLSYQFNEMKNSSKLFYLMLMDRLYHFLFFVFVILIGLLYFYKDDLIQNNSRLYFLGAFFCLSLWTYASRNHLRHLRVLKYSLLFSLLWLFLLPLGLLPLVPSQVEKLVAQNKGEVFVYYRKPFFVEEAINQEITILSPKLLQDKRLKRNDLVFISEEALSRSAPHPVYQPLHRWPVWKRGSSANQILSALKKGSLKSLQEHYALIKIKSKQSP